MFAKAKIKPEQYNILKQQIDAKEEPVAIRVKRSAKPRAKKSTQIDKAIVQTDIEMNSKLPKGKSMKETQKKKEKIVVL